jgi:lipoprotein-anchoring transpeptidase ErfK/SrfK
VTMRRRLVAVALLGSAAIAVALVLLQRSSPSEPAEAGAPSFAAEAGQLPAPERPAFRVGKPVLLPRDETRAWFASVRRAVEARSDPATTAPPVASLERETPEGTTNVVLVLGSQRRADGLWVHVRLPVLPNNLTGWIPRHALGGYQFVHTHLVVDRARLVATLFYDGRKIFTAPVGIGTSGWPTPRGQFYIRNRLSGFGDPFYGPVAFGTSARSAVLTDWPGGGYVGIHGTNAPELIPGRISHGCIRMRNVDILRLSRLMPVGTPLTIR